MGASVGTKGAWAVAVSLSWGSLSGCADPCEVADDQLSLVAVVIDNAQTVRAEVDFDAGERAALPEPWRKCDGDKIRINGQDARETERNGRWEYSLTLDAAEAPRTFTFEIDREVSDAPILIEVELPPAFEVTAPEPGSSLSRSTSTPIQWSPPEPEGQLQLTLFESIGEGVCLETKVEAHDYKRTGGIRVDDDGDWTVPPAAISSPSGGSCEAELQLRRFNDGEYPARLAPGGFVEGRVLRSVPFTSVP